MKALRLRNLLWTTGAATTVTVVGCLLVAPLGDQAAPVQGMGGAAGAGPSGPAAGVGGNSVDAGTAGAGGAGTGGGGGSGGLGACTRNADCNGAVSADEPHRCRDGRCVALKSPGNECPIVFGNVADDNAIFFGAFAGLNSNLPEESPGVLPYRLALEEISGDSHGGLPGGPGGKPRSLVMIVCSGDPAYVDPAMKHLVGDDPDSIGVPAILAYMKPGDLKRAYDSYHPGEIFYMNPVGSNRTLTGEEHHGLMWHMLGQPSDLAPAYAELVRLTERYVRNVRGVGSRPVRLAMVTTTEAFDSELADFVVPALRFNDKDATANGDDYLGVSIDTAKPDLTAAAERVCLFQPDIIVSTAGEWFVQDQGIVASIESAWPNCKSDAGALPRPFYVLSPNNAATDSSYITTLIRAEMKAPAIDSQAYQRFIGINAARAPDPTLYNQFITHLRTRFPGANPSDIAETENFYDAFYYLAYAMDAAGSVATLTGPGIAQGMARLVDGPTTYNMGPTEITSVFSALSVPTAHIRLNGTLGPATFSLATGARVDPGSVFCFFQATNATAVTVHTQVLRYDPTSDGGSAGSFVGDFTSLCFSGFFP